jgi:metallo-beta-lactamase family protein
MKIQFLGAAGQVTGSMYLVETEGGSRILIDCGFDMENKAINYGDDIFPFDPKSIDAVLITHAHIDHTGNLPNLYRLGYEGKVVCTEPTAYLTHLLLMDSAHLHGKQIQDKQKNRRRKNNRRDDRNTHTYLEREVEQTVGRMRLVNYNQRVKLTSDISFKFIQAGHLPGAAHIVLYIEENGLVKTLGFSGDIGRKDYPLLPDPEPMEEVDYLVCESTYGDRNHRPVEESWEILEKVIYETCVEREGKLVIPAFSVGRTQAMLYVLDKLFMQGRLPQIRIFVDSPMAIESTKAFERSVKHLNKEAKDKHALEGSIFDYENVTYVDRASQSRSVSHYHKPCIIISASGMLEGGRIQTHVRENISKPNATIMMVGFCAEGTLGRKLLDQPNFISIGGKQVPVMARITSLDSLSGHADQQGLLTYVRHQNPKKLKKLWLVHGDPAPQAVFEKLLKEEGWPVEIPRKGMKVEAN